VNYRDAHVKIVGNPIHLLLSKDAMIADAIQQLQPRISSLNPAANGSTLQLVEIIHHHTCKLLLPTDTLSQVGETAELVVEEQPMDEKQTTLTKITVVHFTRVTADVLHYFGQPFFFMLNRVK
jgi:hypothetical protein